MVHLLIVDDELVIRQGLLSMDWASMDVHVVAAVDNGLEAVELLQSELIDVVLADIRMPGMDGLELARFILEKELGVEIILLSGHSDFDYARTAMQYHVREYLLKPSDPEEVMAAVGRACKQVDKRREADMRLRLMEAELGKRQLLRDRDGIVLGEWEHSSVSNAIFDYLTKRFKEPISLSSLSEELHFSSIYLSKVIKKKTGYTFLEIVNAMRVDAAAEMLREGGRQLAEICEAVCIRDPRYFSQVFKKHYGVTPTAYKKSPRMPRDQKLAYLVKSIRGEAS